MKKEIWKDIPGYEGLYQVSNLGNVRTFKNGRYGTSKESKPLSLSINGKYLKTSLYLNGNGKRYLVHQLVAMAFLGHVPNGRGTLCVNHIDNNQLNNNVDNLEITSTRHNSTTHKINNGISWSSRMGKWKVEVRLPSNNNNKVHIGYFENKELALKLREITIDNMHLFNGDKNEFRNLIKNKI